MQFFTNVFIFIIAGYLSLVTALADAILGAISSDELEQTASSMTDTANQLAADLTALPSEISAIPDILLTSTKYQQATVIGASGFEGGTTDDPIDAIVNIFCTLRTDNYIRTTTGTGFFVDGDGIVMTNAHVAQFLLLEETDRFGEAECIVRGGNPAAPLYQAELLYLPPAWLVANASVINDAVPLGTGERDYALLYVSETVSGEPLPAMFPALDVDTALLPLSTRETTVTAAGYPAKDLIENGPDTDLIPKQASTTVSELYTFGSNYADIFAIRGSEVGAEGASGGPVVNADGAVIGMIVTRGDDETDGAGSLRAITLSHIDRTITEETGFSLQENLNGNLAYRSEVFAETLTPFLVSILEQQAN